MNDNPFVSVIIPTLNRDLPLRTVLTYLLYVESYAKFEIIIIDQSDAHEQETIDFLAAHAEKLKYFRVKYKNLPKARNNGISLAQGSIVIFIDDDCEPVQGFVSAHVKQYSDPRIIGVAGPTPLPGQSMLSKDDLNSKELQELLTQKHMRFDVSFDFSALWAQGANCSFRRDACIKVGGFDEAFFGAAIGEDAEFSHRIRKIGPIRYTPEPILVHRHVPSGGCRDIIADRERIRAMTFSVNYFWFRVGASDSFRLKKLFSLFRHEVMKRKDFSAAIGFMEGAWESASYIRRLTSAPMPIRPSNSFLDNQ